MKYFVFLYYMKYITFREGRPWEYVGSFHDLQRLMQPTSVMHNQAEQFEPDIEIQDETNPLLNADDKSQKMQWQCVEHGLSSSEIETTQTFAFWVEGVLQLSVGSVGIIFNTAAILVLSSPKMKSVFNKLLICLLLVHNVFIFLVGSKEIMWPAWNDKPDYALGAFFIYLFSYVLHPSQQVMRYSSIFLTMEMARRRFHACRHPIEFRNSNMSKDPWTSAIKILFLVLILSFILTCPLYFETSVKYADIGRLHVLNGTHFKYVSIIYSNESRKNIYGRYIIRLVFLKFSQTLTIFLGREIRSNYGLTTSSIKLALCDLVQKYYVSYSIFCCTVDPVGILEHQYISNNIKTKAVE